MISFEEDIRQVINRHSAESVSGTPDYILAEFLTSALKAFNDAVVSRAAWRCESIELPALQKISTLSEVSESRKKIEEEMVSGDYEVPKPF